MHPGYAVEDVKGLFRNVSPGVFHPKDDLVFSGFQVQEVAEKEPTALSAEDRQAVHKKPANRGGCKNVPLQVDRRIVHGLFFCEIPERDFRRESVLGFHLPRPSLPVDDGACEHAGRCTWIDRAWSGYRLFNKRSTPIKGCFHIACKGQSDQTGKRTFRVCSRLPGQRDSNLPFGAVAHNVFRCKLNGSRCRSQRDRLFEIDCRLSLAEYLFLINGKPGNFRGVIHIAFQDGLCTGRGIHALDLLESQLRAFPVHSKLYDICGVPAHQVLGIDADLLVGFSQQDFVLKPDHGLSKFHGQVLSVYLNRSHKEVVTHLALNLDLIVADQFVPGRGKYLDHGRLCVLLVPKQDRPVGPVQIIDRLCAFRVL